MVIKSAAKIVFPGLMSLINTFGTDGYETENPNKKKTAFD